MKKTLIISTLALLAFVGFQAHAQDSTDPNLDSTQAPVPTLYSDSSTTQPSIGSALRMQRENFKKEIEQKREDIKAQLEQKREDIKSFRDSMGKLREGKQENPIENSDSTVTKEEREKILEMKKDFYTKMEDFHKKMDEKRAELKNKIADKISVRFEASVARLENLISRVQSRIDKIKAAGADVTVAQTNLDKASADLVLAKTSADAVTLVDPTDPASIKANLDSIKLVKDAFVKVQKDLSDTVKVLRPIQATVKDSTEASSNSASHESTNPSSSTDSGSTTTTTSTN